MTPEQLRKRALEMGAEVEIGGERFNTARQQMKTRPPPKPKAPPAPPAPDYITRQEAKAMLDDLNEAWEQRMDILLATLQKPAAPPHRKPTDVDFKYAKDGRVTGATILPRD